MLNSDIPERLYERLHKLTDDFNTDESFMNEATWIHARLVEKQVIENISDELRRNYDRTDIMQVLKYIRLHHLDVPFIDVYKRDDLPNEMTIDDLWLIDSFDEKWINLQLRERSLLQSLEKIQKRYNLLKNGKIGRLNNLRNEYANRSNDNSNDNDNLNSSGTPEMILMQNSIDEFNRILDRIADCMNYLENDCYQDCQYDDVEIFLRGIPLPNVTQRMEKRDYPPVE